MLLDMGIPAITVVGVGNILVQDEGLGVRTVEYMQEHMKFPEELVQLLDGGTLGMDLLPYIGGTKKLLIIDAINARDEAGKFYRFEGEHLNEYFSNQISVHDLGVNDMLAALKITEEPIDEVIVIGYSPYVVDLGVDLTPEMAVKIPELAEIAKGLVEKWIQEYQQ